MFLTFSGIKSLSIYNIPIIDKNDVVITICDLLSIFIGNKSANIGNI